MNDKRKNSGEHYKKSYKKPKKYVVGHGMKGFLCTYNFQEKACMREAFNILNKYADKLYGLENAAEEPNTTSENDIEDDLENELNQLKDNAKKTFKRRFQVLDSGAKNIMFVKSEIGEPVKIACDIVTDIYESQVQQSRHLIRLIPIEMTCNISDIQIAILPLLESHFKENPQSFSIICNARNNTKVVKMDIITAVADLVGTMRTDHTVNLKQANITIVIEIIKSIAMLSVIPNYLKYKKFNLIITNEEQSEENLICKVQPDMLPDTTIAHKSSVSTGNDENVNKDD